MWVTTANTDKPISPLYCCSYITTATAIGDAPGVYEAREKLSAPSFPQSDSEGDRTDTRFPFSIQ